MKFLSFFVISLSVLIFTAKAEWNRGVHALIIAFSPILSESITSYANRQGSISVNGENNMPR
jgi:hypothetical protein